MSPKTELRYRRLLAEAGLLDGEPDRLPELGALKAVVQAAIPDTLPQQASSVTAWTGEVVTMLEHGATPKAIFDRLRLEHDHFTGSLSAIKRLCARLRKAEGIKPEDVAIPVQTEPGEVAQVDFGYVGKLWDPTEGRFRRGWAFVMVLGYSRHMVVRIVFDQKVETWLRLHVEAFEELGGVPKVIVPDNLKAAVIRAAFGVDGAPVLNRSYRELARHYGFKVDPTPPRSPEKKGKVESGVKYVKRSFFKPRAAQQDVEVLRAELARWVVEIAGRREHGTTRTRPLEVFETIEREALLPLPQTRWRPVVWREAKVHQDAHVLVERALYSVPWRLIGKRVQSRSTGNSVELYFEDARVATHERIRPGQRRTKEEHLPAERRDLRHRGRDYWVKRAAAMGDDVERFVHEVFDSDQVVYQLRAVQQIVRYLENHPPERARAACRRASFYGNHTYVGIKNILRRALDRQPLPTVVLDEPSQSTPRPRFARDVHELLQLPLEKTDAPH